MATVRRSVVSSAPTERVENRWYVGPVKRRASTRTGGRASGGGIMAAARGRGPRESQQPPW